MKGKKIITLCNLNCKFEKNKKTYPMLDYFNIVKEALFLEKHFRNMFLYEVKLIETKTMGYCIYGKIVKNTHLEINSKYDEKNKILNELSKTEIHQSSPYSEFILILKNHRLIFTPSQKGSPTIKNLESVLKRNIKSILKIYNHQLNEEKEMINLHFFDIMEVPKKTNVYNDLVKFEKISLFSLKFIELNNDLLNDYFESTQVLKDEIGSNEIVQNFKNPMNKKIIAKMIEKSAGKISIMIKARKKGEVKEKIYKNDDFKEKLEVIFPAELVNDEENILSLIDKRIDDQRLKEVSQDNENTYKKFLENMKEIIFKLLH